MSRAPERDILIDPRGAALVVGGRLEDLILDPVGDDDTPGPGAIFPAKVNRLVPKIGAAFVRLADGPMGFLREARAVREGESLLVQVVSIPEPGKAMPVTTRVLYKTRTVLHTPHAPGVNVSRQIRDDAEKARLRHLAEAASRALTDEPPALVIRTAARGAEPEELRADVERAFQMRTAAEAGSSVVESAEDIALREWEGRPLRGQRVFAEAGIWDEIDRLASPRVELPSGGWMTVEPTAALVAVDVNTGGGFQGGDALTASLEAARELPRQLRLRGLGGLVMIDFAPVGKRDRRRLDDALKTAFGRDPVETSLAGWTTLGLFEIQRKRERRPLSELVERL